MAYEYDFSKNIPLASGFGVGLGKPVDLRTVVNTIAQRDEHITKGRAFPGLQVYVTDTKATYVYEGEGTIPTTYKKTTDTSIVAGKKYYTKNGTTYTEVTNPVVEHIGDYYEVDEAAHEGHIWNKIAFGEGGVPSGDIPVITDDDIESLFD